MTKCPHQCKTGCGIYANRPVACKTYTCAWLTGILPYEARPDKSGLLGERMDLTTQAHEYIATVIMWWEMKPGAMFEIDELFENIPEWHVYIIHRHGGGEPIVAGDKRVIPKVVETFSNMDKQLFQFNGDDRAMTMEEMFREKEHEVRVLSSQIVEGVDFYQKMKDET